jgi:hypothetical protein
MSESQWVKKRLDKVSDFLVILPLLVACDNKKLCHCGGCLGFGEDEESGLEERKERGR